MTRYQPAGNNSGHPLATQVALFACNLASITIAIVLLTTCHLLSLRKLMDVFVLFKKNSLHIIFF